MKNHTNLLKVLSDEHHSTSTMQKNSWNKNLLASSLVNETAHGSVVSSGTMSLTQGHVGHPPTQQTAAYWHPAVGGAYGVSSPQN